MKKILLILFTALLMIPLWGQERELSDYEKYRMEKENELYQTEEEVFFIVEDMPKFQGEDGKEFRKYIAENVKYPEEAVKNGVTGKVIISFIVNKEGKVVNAKVEKSVDPYLDAEAIRVVESSPKWMPGKQRGKAVNVQFTFPINFVLDTPVESETVVINNYYDYTQPNLRFNLAFGYGYGYHYQPYYGYYDNWYGYYPYNYYGYGYYPYYGYNYYYGHNHYYGHNYYNYGYYSRPRGQRYATSNALGWNRNYYKPYNKTYSSGYVSAPTAAKKNVVTTRTQSTRPTYSESNRSYTPTYKNPRMSTRPSYNSTTTRSKTTSVQPQSRSVQQRSTTVRTQSSTTRSTSSYSRPSSSTRPTYQKSATQSRSYSAPSRSSYSAPSRSSSSYSRPSGSSSSGRSYSSGSASRSSSGSASRSGGKK